MDVALKQRLVGATVLIALAVVVLPMILGGRPEQVAEESRKIELPPQPAELDFQTRRFPVGEAPASESPPESATAEPSPGAVRHVELEPRNFEDALQDAVPPAADPAAAAAVEPAPAVAEEPGPETAPPASPPPEPTPAEPTPAEPERVVAAPAAVGSGRYIVQVASFGSLENASRLAATLQGEGYGVLSDTVKSDVGTLHRVRIGPFGSESEASQAATRVRQRVEGVNPRVVDLQPDLAAQVTTPSDPLVRWVVQVGSFASTDNAEKLVERLRGEGLSAYKEAVTSSGATVYRVRVGPYVERDEAIRVGGQVRERFSLDGVVMSAD